MNLTPQEESDLAGLAAELGNPESDARARQLLATHPEAGAFFRQITSICRALEVEERSGPPPLSADETEALAAVILARVTGNRTRRRLLLRHPWRLSGVAAAIVVAVGTWFWFSRPYRPIVAEAVTVPAAMSVGVESQRKAVPAPVRAGQTVSALNHRLVLVLTNGNLLVLAPGARLKWPDAGDDIQLEAGMAYVEASAPLRLTAGRAGIRLEGPGAKVTVEAAPGGVNCSVHAGGARIIRQGRETQLSEGQRGIWDPAAEGVQVEPFAGQPNAWAQEALDLAGRR